MIAVGGAWGTGMFRRLIIASLAVVACADVVVAAQDKMSAASEKAPVASPSLYLNPYFRSLGLAEGMPSSEVAKVVEDRDGFIWIGTHDGLVRYDGVGFRLYRHDEADPESISADDVAIVFVDKDNRIWCGGENSGLNMLDTTRTGFKHFLHEANDSTSLAAQDVWSIGQDADGAIWVGGPTTGIERLNADGKTFTHYRHDDANADTPGSDRIFAIYGDARGRVWFGHTKGVDRRDRNGHFLHADFSAVPGEERINAFSLAAEDGDHVLAATRRGVVRIDEGLKATGLVNAGLTDLRTLSLARTPKGELWIGTLHGLNRADGAGRVSGFLMNAMQPGSLPADYVQDAFADREGGLWFATQGGGVARLPPRWDAFSLYRSAAGASDGLATDRIQNLALAADGRVWAVSEEGSIDRLEPESGKVEHYGGRWPVAEKLLESILVGRDGQVWVGHVRGLRIYDGSGASFVDLPASADDKNALLPGKIDILREDASGGVWARSWGTGIDRIDAKTHNVERFEGETAGLRGPDVSAIEFDADGNLLAAMSAGIDRFDGALRRFVPLAGMTATHVLEFAFAPEPDGGLWVHTLGALERYDYRHGKASRTQRIGVAEGWPTLSAGGMQVDSRGRVWVTSARGIWQFDPAQRSVRQFDTHDGLASAEFTVAPMLKRADGALFAATRLGIVAFEPQRIDGPAQAPPVVLDALSVRRGGRAASLDPHSTSVALQWDDRDLRASARVLSYVNAAASRYQWRLDGVDADWVDTGNRGEREYSQLPGGTHALHIRAAAAGGAWQELPPLAIEQAPPPWRTPWAYAAYALAIALVGWLAFRSYRRRIDARHAVALADQQRRYAEQASAAKTNFLATMGHEIRTPMTGVLGMAELLMRTSLDDRQRGYAEAIESSGRVMLRLINDSLDLARIEAGKLELESAPLDLRALVADIVALAQTLATDKGLAFDCAIDADAPHWVSGDAVRIRQVFVNLVNNAIKFTEKGRIDLALGADASGAAIFSVRDTGPGMAEATRARLFQRFEQAQGAQRFGGSGLGLAICRELVACMGGSISLASEQGVGSTFIVTLPLPAAEASDGSSEDAAVAAGNLPMKAAGAASAASAALRALDVLLVEDDATVAAVIVGQLAAHGCRVRHVAQGLAALSEIAVQRFDAALVDLDLPGLDGLALARTLRASEAAERRARLPLIGISARSVGNEEALCLDAGMDAFLRKPVSGAKLLESLIASCGHAAV